MPSTLTRPGRTARRWHAGRPIAIEKADTIADGIAVRVPVAKAVERIKNLVDEMVLVNDLQLLDAMRLAVFREVGDPWMAANTENNLGNAARDLGDYPAAAESYASSLRTFAGLDDHWALAILLEDIGLLAVRTGDHARAVELAAAATALREAIGAQHPKALAAELRKQLAPSVRALGPDAARKARRSGRSLGVAGAVALGMRICEAA